MATASGVQQRKALTLSDDSIIPASAKTSSTVGYGLWPLAEDWHIIGMTTVGSGSNPVYIQGLEPVVVHREKCLYVGLLPEEARKKLEMKQISTQVDFEVFRHAFIPPNLKTMKDIRKRLEKAHPDGVYFSHVLLYSIVEDIVKDEAARKSWLAIK